MAKRKPTKILTPPMPPPEVRYQPATWERVLAALCAIAILGLVFLAVLRKEPFPDSNQVVLIRTMLSLAIAIIGAVVPGFLEIDWRGRGLGLRVGGALALFVITFYSTPKVLPLGVSPTEIKKIEKTTEETNSNVTRLVTKFEAVLVQTVFELPQNNPSVKALADSVIAIATAVRRRSEHHPAGLAISNESSVGEVISIELHEILEERFVKLSPKLIDLLPLITFLKQPKLQIGINRSPRDSSDLVNSLLGLKDPPDLHLFVHAWPVDPKQGHFGKVMIHMSKQKHSLSGTASNIHNKSGPPHGKWFPFRIAITHSSS